jgi:hypothetical protein
MLARASAPQSILNPAEIMTGSRARRPRLHRYGTFTVTVAMLRPYWFVA